ncbi:hypothetical protein ACFJGW_10895 [Burkholderiaceae bacterium UC74_6]
MHLERASSFLFLVWTIVAALVWWRRVKSPWLFLTVTLLAGLGAQAVSDLLWAMWQASGNQFVSVSPGEAQAVSLRDAAFHAVVTLCIVAPVCLKLSKRL